MFKRPCFLIAHNQRLRLLLPLAGTYTGSNDDGEWSLPQPACRPSSSHSVPIQPIPGPSKPQLGPVLTAPAPFKTGRIGSGKTPALSLNLSAISHDAHAQHDDQDSSAYYGGLHTPLAHTSDGGYGQTVRQRTDQTQNDEKTITHMPSDLADALRKMRVTGQQHRQANEAGVGESTPRNRSRSSSIASGNHSDLVALVGDATSDHGGELDPSDYETLERLGEGASGAVEKVRDRKTGKIMALKVSLGEILAAFRY